MEQTPVSVTLTDNPAIQGRETSFMTVTIELEPILASWKNSLFAHEWLHRDGTLKAPDEQPDKVREKRKVISGLIRKGESLERPVLGMGILDTVEIGAGRDVLLTLASQGLSRIDVHIPKSHLGEFKPFIKRAERGSAIFYILIAIVLLSALSFAVANSMRSGTSNMTDQKVKLTASEIIDAGNRLSEAVTRMRLHDIAKNSISFENSTVAGYDYAGCSDDTCRIFAHDGGGLVWEIPPSGSLTDSTRTWGYTGNIAVPEVGTASAELLAVLPALSLELCQHINGLLGVASSTETPLNIPATVNASKFVGSYTVSSTLPASNLIKGKKAACVQADTVTGTAWGASDLTDAYFYYQVLIAQ
jgi:hypothetical protein